jgi:hypothetical protein
MATTKVSIIYLPVADAIQWSAQQEEMHSRMNQRAFGIKERISDIQKYEEILKPINGRVLKAGKKILEDRNAGKHCHKTCELDVLKKANSFLMQRIRKLYS